MSDHGCIDISRAIHQKCQHHTENQCVNELHDIDMHGCKISAEIPTANGFDSISFNLPKEFPGIPVPPESG